jgi:hypothetical protein
MTMPPTAGMARRAVADCVLKFGSMLRLSFSPAKKGWLSTPAATV